MNIAPHSLEQRMPWRHPFQRRIVAKKLFVEHHALVLAAQTSITGFQALTDDRERVRHPAHAIHVRVAPDRSRMHSSDGSGSEEEILDDLGHQTPLLGFDGLPD